MKAYLVERPASDWCQGYAMIIIAKDERHTERKARVSSDTSGNAKRLLLQKLI